MQGSPEDFLEEEMGDVGGRRQEEAWLGSCGKMGVASCLTSVSEVRESSSLENLDWLDLAGMELLELSIMYASVFLPSFPLAPTLSNSHTCFLEPVGIGFQSL